VTRGRFTLSKGVATLVVAMACVLVAPAVAGAAFVAPPLLAQATANPSSPIIVVVLGQPNSTSQLVRRDVRKVDGAVKKQFDVIPGVLARLTGSQLLALADEPTVRSITPDGRVRGQSVTSGFIWPRAAGVTPLLRAAAPDAPAIAIVDSGVDSRRTADFGDRVTGVDFTCLQCAIPDKNGHGTLVAGIAAGASSYATGASPTSNIVSLRVVNSDGSAFLSDVISAADWIFTNRFAYNIRVANFSLSSAFPGYALSDPLDAAVRNLWLTGTVVVTAAGNNGPGRMIYAPANDPFVITVGASDIADTVGRGDDGAPTWTSYGYTPEGFAKPEIGAPGRYMVGPVPPNSTLALLFPDHVINATYMYLSGTSFAAPVVSGIAAQILARHPGWSPDEVKGALMKTATTAPYAPPPSLGLGEVNGVTAAAVAHPPNPNVGLYQFVRTGTSGDPYFDADAWNAYVAANASWTDASWTDASWTDASWTDASWTDASWTDASWTDASWTDASWTDASWTDASWTDASWTDAANGD
jgi:serine protease AprX